jgi:hypothetical protein
LNYISKGNSQNCKVAERTSNVTILPCGLKGLDDLGSRGTLVFGVWRSLNLSVNLCDLLVFLIVDFWRGKNLFDLKDSV